MESDRKILFKILEKLDIESSDFRIIIDEIIENECCKTLQRIKEIMEKENLSAFDCVEEIICLFESTGINVV